MTSQLQLIIFVLISIAVAVTSGKQIGEPSSKLMLEYNWPEPKKNLGRYPHAKSCSQFYVTRPDGSQSVKECPKNELFDFRTLRCRPKVLAKCWKDLLKKDHSKKIKRHFSCPFPWGLYPDIEDCSTFYDCMSGKPYLQKCPSSTLFDKAQRTCVNENEALCADHSDIVEKDYKCPYKWGYFTYSKDCSKFYECLRKVPSLRSCKKNMLFDNLQRKCMPMSDVNCGERFNPYKKDKQSTEHVSTGEKGITTEIIPSGRILETIKFTSTGEEAMTGRVSNTGGETPNISPAKIIEDTSELTTVRKDITSNCRIGSTRNLTPSRGVQGAKQARLATTTEDVTIGRISNGGDRIATKITPTGGVQKITKPFPSSEDVTAGRFPNGGDGMTSKVTPTEGVQKILKLTPTSEDVKTGSNGEMTTRHIPRRETQETSKLSPTGENITERISVEEERDKFTYVSTERIKTSGERLTPEIIPVAKEQKASDERL